MGRTTRQTLDEAEGDHHKARQVEEDAALDHDARVGDDPEPVQGGAEGVLEQGEGQPRDEEAILYGGVGGGKNSTTTQSEQ